MKYINFVLTIDALPRCIGNESTAGYKLTEKDIKILLHDLKKRLMKQLEENK